MVTNKSPAVNDGDLNRSPRQFEESDNIKVVAKTGDIVDSYVSIETPLVLVTKKIINESLAD